MARDENLKEAWKDIPGWPNYQASTFGGIRFKDSGLDVPSWTSGWGYLAVKLGSRPNRHTRYVHKLVAETFIRNPDNKPKVNHDDGNKMNNRIDNLYWATTSENNEHAYRTGLKTISDNVRESARRMALDPKTRQAAFDRHPNIKIIETGEVFESNVEVARELGVKPPNIYKCARGEQKSVRGCHLEYTDEPPTKITKRKNSILYDFQYEAVAKAFNGCIFNGGTGTGKSRTGLYFYFKEQGGSYVGSDYIPMRNPKDLYIITPAVKRDKGEWITELALFRMDPDPELNYYNNKIVIDSWNNIKKYIDVKGAFFIWDEDKICGGGAWTKAFLKIAKNNDWIILSASPGDTWLDYWSVFVANGFYKNKTEFQREHVIYSRYSKFPQVERYLNTQRLERLRNRILIDMSVQRHTRPHHADIYCNYNIPFYKDVFKKRWDPYKDEPLKQASELCYVLRKIVNSDESRQVKLLELLEDHPRAIIFYSYDYERDILMNLGYSEGTKIAEWTGHKHEPIPTGKKWVYLVNYASGAEGFNCVSTDTIIFYSQTYSYKTLLQSIGRIDRLDTKFIDLYYYHLKSRSGIDLAISKALKEKKAFNENRWLNSWK